MARPTKAEMEAKIRAEMEATQAEIKAGIEKGIQEMLPGIIAGLAAQLGSVTAGASVVPSAAMVVGEGQVTTKSVVEALAHAMAKAADPANKRRIVPPEVMERRAKAREEMNRLILENHAAGLQPVYVVVRPTFLNEILIHPQYQDPQTKRMVDQEINWPHIPNQAMQPTGKALDATGQEVQSDAAARVYSLYLATIDAKPGHIINGISLTPEGVEPGHIPLSELPAPMVMTGKGEVRRGHPGAPQGAVAVSDALSFDPRRGGVAGNPKTANILGTTAPRAVVS